MGMYTLFMYRYTVLDQGIALMWQFLRPKPPLWLWIPHIDLSYIRTWNYRTSNFGKLGPLTIQDPPIRKAPYGLTQFSMHMLEMEMEREREREREREKEKEKEPEWQRKIEREAERENKITTTWRDKHEKGREIAIEHNIWGPWHGTCSAEFPSCEGISSLKFEAQNKLYVSPGIAWQYIVGLQELEDLEVALSADPAGHAPAIAAEAAVPLQDRQDLREAESHETSNGDEFAAPEDGPDGIRSYGLNEIPDMDDLSAPKPKVGEPTLSAEAIRSRARRIFTKRANGELKVSKEIFDEWHRKGSERKNLETIFQQCGYSPDWESCIHVYLRCACMRKVSEQITYNMPQEVFISEVEVLRSELYETDVTVEGEYLSDQQMIDEGFSENFGPNTFWNLHYLLM